MLVLLDSGPLGLASNPKATPEALACQQWLASLVSAGVDVCISEIIDYEIRRELMLHNKQKGLKRLDTLELALNVEPISSAALLRAAELWAQVRKLGKGTADVKALDIDVILAAHAKLLETSHQDVIVATTNVKHISLFVTAVHWQNVSPP